VPSLELIGWVIGFGSRQGQEFCYRKCVQTGSRDPVIQCVPGTIVQAVKRLGPEVLSWNWKCSQLYLRCSLQPLEVDKFNVFSFERGTHFRNSTLFLTLLRLFFSITFFILSFIFYSFFSLFLPFLLLLSSSLFHFFLAAIHPFPFFPYFLPLVLPFVSVSLNALCPLYLQFLFPAPSCIHAPLYVPYCFTNKMCLTPSLSIAP
jgi:hypothetical protein